MQRLEGVGTTASEGHTYPKEFPIFVWAGPLSDRVGVIDVLCPAIEITDEWMFAM